MMEFDRQGDFALTTSDPTLSASSNVSGLMDNGEISDDDDSDRAASDSSSEGDPFGVKSIPSSSTLDDPAAGNRETETATANLISLNVPTAKRTQKRKRIRKVFDDVKLSERTKELQRRERERRERVGRLDTIRSMSLEGDLGPSTSSSVLCDRTSPLTTPEKLGEDAKESDAVEVIELSSDEEDYSDVSRRRPKWGHFRPPIQFLGSRGILARRAQAASSASSESSLLPEKKRKRRHSGDLENTERTGDGQLLVNAGKPEGDPDIFVAEHLADVLQPHQLGGVRFLYDNIIESIEEYKNSDGFGCILAHSMGLGKTIQVITFIDIFLRATDARKVLVIVPINTIQNWKNEFDMWMPRMTGNGQLLRRFPVHILGDAVKGGDRVALIDEWHKSGGVLLIGYEMFRILLQNSRGNTKPGRKATRIRTDPIGSGKTTMDNGLGIVDLEEEESRESTMKNVKAALIDPGPDLVVCDEGHRIKNLKTEIAQALNNIRTKRRIVMTGYPLQNNLMEYFCMVDFVRPMHLGTRKQFGNMFERPIKNGLCVDSTANDVRVARQRTHVLVEQLKGFVQRRTHHLLRAILPPSREYVLLSRKSPIQHALYRSFVIYAQSEMERGTAAIFNPLKAFAACCKIWNHPDLLYNLLQKQKQSTSQATIQSSPIAASTMLDQPTAIPFLSVPPPPYPTGFPLCNGGDYSNSIPATTLMDGLSWDPNSNSSSNQSFYSGYGTNGNGLMDNRMYGGGGSYGYNYPFEVDHTSNSSFPKSTFGSMNYGQPPIASNSNYPLERLAYDSQLQSPMNQSSQPAPMTAGDFLADFDFDDLLGFGDQRSNEATVNPTSNTAVKRGPGRPPNSTNGQSNSIGGTIDDPSLSTGLRYDWAEESMKDYVPGILENGYKMSIAFAIIEAATKKDEKVLLFSQSLLTLNLIEEYLANHSHLQTAAGEQSEWRKNKNYCRFDGSTSATEREKLISRFNKDPGICLFLISTRAGSLGINLVSSNRVIIYDASWNPCHDAQAVCRVYRYGQQRPTYIYRLIVDNSMERSIFNRQIGKSGLQQRVVDDHHIDANVTQRELETLLIYDEALDVRSDDWDTSEWEIDDEILSEIAAKLSRMFAQVPFLHESLMLEREDAMSEQEKLEARLLYERERQQFGRTAAIDETILSGPGAGMGRLGLPNERLWAGQQLNFNMQRFNAVRPQPRPTPFPMTVERIDPNTGNGTIADVLTNMPTSGPVGSNAFLRQLAPSNEPIVRKIIMDREISLPDVNTRAFVSLMPGQEVWLVKSKSGIFLRLSDNRLLDAKNTIYDDRNRQIPDYFGMGTALAHTRGLPPFQHLPAPPPALVNRQPIAEVVISDSE